jgi:hypothetical protein
MIQYIILKQQAMFSNEKSTVSKYWKTINDKWFKYFIKVWFEIILNSKLNCMIN